MNWEENKFWHKMFLKYEEVQIDQLTRVNYKVVLLQDRKGHCKLNWNPKFYKHDLPCLIIQCDGFWTFGLICIINNFVYFHWRCISNYRSMSFRSSHATFRVFLLRKMWKLLTLVEWQICILNIPEHTYYRYADGNSNPMPLYFCDSEAICQYTLVVRFYIVLMFM